MRLCNSTLNADRLFCEVNVLPLQSQDLFRPQGMQGVQCEVISVHRLFDVGDVLYQVAHLFHSVGLNRCAGFAGNSNTARVQWISLNGFMDSKGQTIVEPKYKEVYDFAYGRAAVQNTNGKWGFIDVNGREVIPCKYSEVTSFASNGWADVSSAPSGSCVAAL